MLNEFITPKGDEDLARMLAELEALSDDEAQRQLSDKGATRS